MRFKLLVLLVFVQVLCFGQDIEPQNYLPNIKPPSPEAYALGTYGNVPVGLFTGSPNIKIPLLTFKTKNISIPFEISYTSNGIKVDDVNSKVGLGWNLIGGGVISRVIRDQPDEESELEAPDINMFEYVNPSNVQYFQAIGENPNIDSEADMFNFNFLNYSGKFVYSKQGEVITMPQSDLKIEPYYDPLSPDIYNFKITTNDGTVFYFQEKERTMLRTSGEGHSEPVMNYTSWYLTKIVHPLGEEIYLEYYSDGAYYIASQSQQLSKSYPSFQYQLGEAYSKPPTFSSIYSHHTRISGKTISQISSNNPFYGSLQFIYEEIALTPLGNEEPASVIKEILFKNNLGDSIDKVNLNYTTTVNNRIFLNQITFKDIDKKYSFEYIDPTSFPLRLNKGQDHWGYYNGANNTHLIPAVIGYGFENTNYNAANKEPNFIFSQKGLLKKITYPTKGFTELSYEPNSYNQKNLKVLPPNKVSYVLDVNTYDNSSASTTHQMSVFFDQSVELFGDSYFYNCEDDFNLGPDKHKSIASVFCVEDNSLVYLYKYDQFGFEVGPSQSSFNVKTENGKFHFFAKKGKTYIVTIENKFSCIRGFLNIKYYNQDYIDVPNDQNVLTGGVRLKKTSDFDFDSKKLDSKTYYYSKIDQLNISSGEKGAMPFYMDNRIFRKTNIIVGAAGSFPYKEFEDIVVTSSSLNNLYNSGGNICYKYVSVSHGGENFENGGEEKEFAINRDVPGKTIFNSKDIRNSPYSNLGWNHGLEIKSKLFKQTPIGLKIISQTENTYTKNDSKTVEQVNFSSRKNYENILEGPAVYTCTSEDVNHVYTRNVCLTNHNHCTNVGTGKCGALGAYNVVQIVNYHPCFGKSPGEQVVYVNRLYNIDIVEYKNISYKFDLTSSKSTNYFYDNSNSLTGSVVSTKEFDYSSPNHLNLTSQRISTSLANEVLETKYFYPQDPGMDLKPFAQELITKNMVTIPLVTQTFKNGKISEQETIYERSAATSDLLLPKNILAAKFPKSDNLLENKVAFDKYDDKGNLLQYTQEGGMNVSIIWGYGKTQPIAKIENANYNQIQQYVSNLQDLSDGTNEQSLNLALNDLRNNLPNAMVTTYTHKPLIGISTVTDPKGQKTTYEYDEFNRLKQVKDHQGNILSENQYHYRP